MDQIFFGLGRDQNGFTTNGYSEPSKELYGNTWIIIVLYEKFNQASFPIQNQL